MVMTQYGITYAVHLISSHFGDLVSKVCECLLRRGTLAFPQIVKYTELTQQQVKNSLLVLIQHNCVQAFVSQQPGGFGEEMKVITQYIALFDNILHRIRFSKFIAIVSKELDKECVELLEGLLQHGRLTLKQMFDRAKSSQNEGCHNVQESFLKLLSTRYVERCPAPEPFLAPPNENEAPKKRGAKSAKIIEISETIEQLVLAAAAPMEAKRFSIITDTETDVDEGKSENGSTNMIVGEKRKHDSLETDSNCGSTEKQNVLWRANFEEFIRCFRHKTCIENVRERLDDGAAIVLSSVLEATRSAEKKVKTENSVPLSLNDIFEGVIKSETGRSMTLDHVRASLALLGCPPGVRGSDESYSIDLKNILRLAQNDEVESLVFKRYGRDAYRIFRLLSKEDRLLETDKIANDTFVEKKDAPKILYKMWKDEYLHMEKIVVSGARQSQLLLWKINKRPLWEQVLDEMYHAAFNLTQRLSFEVEKENELLVLPRSKRVGTLSVRDKRLLGVRILLESSLVKLDDAIMLFHDF